jgi:hypothetical protein
LSPPSKGDLVNFNLVGDDTPHQYLQRAAMHYLTAAGLLPFQHLHKKWTIWREVGARDQPGMTPSFGRRSVLKCRCGWAGIVDADRYLNAVWHPQDTAEMNVIRRHIEELAVSDPHSALWRDPALDIPLAE